MSCPNQHGSRPMLTLCPVCFQQVEGEFVGPGDAVSLSAVCPEHGEWQTPVWIGSPSFDSWGAESTGGCCGGAASGSSKTCTAVLEVTHRCDLSCPVCFADSSPASSLVDPPVDELLQALQKLIDDQGPVNLQFSGGEPTLRRDLDVLIRGARKMGFTFIQVNTNGLRLARDSEYAAALCHAGIESVFLQFDGLSDDIYRALRGRPLLEEKLQAIANCEKAGLGVVLVPTVLAGVNSDQLGSLARFAAERSPTVRGLHLQPISHFGRYPGRGRLGLTLPQVLNLLEEQTHEEVRVDHFRPSACEHARCSFRARYMVRDDDGLELFAGNQSLHSPPGDPAKRAIAATSRQWSRPLARDGSDTADALGRFLADTRRILSISGMMFQDAWNIDLARIDRCCVHSLVPGRGPIPFCLWNLTSASGQRFFPRS